MRKQWIITGEAVLMFVFGLSGFANADSGHLAVLKSEDNGVSWSYVDRVVIPGDTMQPVDPSPLFEVGKIVLYFFDGNPINDKVHTIYRAESDNGIQFSTPKEVYSCSEYPITDPCVIKLPNDTYRMYLSYGTHTLSAASSDGLTFTSEDGFRTDQAGIPGVIVLPDGTYMLYGGGGSHKSISSYTSIDGLNFELVTTEAIEAGIDVGCETPGCELCDPHPIQLQDESYLMTYKVRPEGETDPFSDKIFLATGTDGQNWDTDGKMIREGSVPAVVQKDDSVLLMYYMDFSSPPGLSTSSSVPSTTTTTTVKGPCISEFIYGNHSEAVEVLRCIRDNVLSRTLEGKELIRLYYQWSPAIVKVMKEDEEFREEVKEMIDGVLVLVGGEVE
jgi:hypothetical protein